MLQQERGAASSEAATSASTAFGEPPLAANLA